ncbi:MAG: metallophosphoesterase [Candidatus Woesearchaeota archaeon]
MKILAFTDLHAGVTAYKRIQEKIRKEKPDYIFCLGDFTIFEQNIEAVIRKIAELKKPVYIIHGNHETDVIVKKLCKRYPNMHYVHRMVVPLENYTLVAHGGGGFYGQGKLSGDKDFERFVKENKKKLKNKIILITHAPPGYTKLDYLNWMDDHAGCASYAEFIKQYKPVLALSGHLHENFGVKYKEGKTIICNPGPEGMVFKL